MSLLTEKQIEEIIDIATQQSEFAEILKLKLDHWNSNQTAQFEPDWSNAPEKATQTVVNSFWVDANGDTFGVYKTYYDRPKPVITPHPHASLMTKYAEVAQRRRDPWVEFEHKCDDLDDSYWIQCDMFIGFHADYFYRHIGDDK
jgi:hypothetical protein